MKKVISITALILMVFSIIPMSLSAATTMTQPIIWSDTDGDGFEDYTDSLGNMWMTLTIDENGNRLIVSKEVLGGVQFNEKTGDGTDWDYEGSILEQEMETFYNGGDENTKINDTVYYLAPELKAVAQPVVLPESTSVFLDASTTAVVGEETVVFESTGAYALTATGGLSYVDESGEATCFALSATEIFTYMSNAEGSVQDPARAATMAEGANNAVTGEDYGTPGAAQGYRTRSGGSNSFGNTIVNSTGVVGNRANEEVYGFRPALWVSEADTDMDGLTDSEEVALGTDPTNIDTDGDNVDDYEEVTTGQDGYITNPLSSDTDGDGLDDRKEASNATNPNNADTDNDGVIDGEEVALGINPLSADSDNDGLIDGEELALGTNPLSADSDNDGIADGEEVTLGTDPLTPDSDLVEVENDDTNQEENLEETGSKPFMVFFAIAVSAFAIALYTRFKATK